MRSLMWFRSDLRVGDNTALCRAAERAAEGARDGEGGGEVVGLFLVSPGQWRAHDWAACKVDFILRCVQDLSARLAELNIPLLVRPADRFSDAAAVVLETARSCGCTSVHYNIEHEVNESRRDDQVRRACEAAGIAVHAHLDQTVFPPDSIRTGQGTFYTVFTPFKKAWLARAEEQGLVPPRPRPGVQAPTGIESDAPPLSVEGFQSAVPGELWPAGEQEAETRLKRFVAERIGRYAKDRDAPALVATSGLSPYLAAGAISPRRCVAAAVEVTSGRAEGAKGGPTTWISEIIWREFYRHILVGFPRVSMGRAFKIPTDRIPWNDDARSEAFAAWCEGRTGFPIVDAGMRQLVRTGWMHNRVRMITAMFLTKDLFLNWRLGERFFMRHLVDGDLANNNGGWQWSASTGNDAAPYFRIFNPTSQSRANDPTGAYIRRWVPELAPLEDDEIHDPPPLAREATGYPAPIVDRTRTKERVVAAFKGVAAGKAGV